MEHHYPPYSRATTVIRAIFGMGLTSFGAYVIVQVLLKVKEAFENPEILNVFLRLVPEDPALRAMTFGDQQIVLPLLSFHYVSYGLSIALLFVAGLLGGSLLKRGIYLLVP